MSEERQFPVIASTSREERANRVRLDCPASVPWSLLAPHAAQAMRNHSQTLERLAERGGLSPCEMVAVIHDRRWEPMSDDDAVAALRKELQRG
jgi:hypothetical protein